MARYFKVPGVMMADNRWNKGSGYHRFIKRQKNRTERHRAKIDPECGASYGRYRGYES